MGARSQPFDHASFEPQSSDSTLRGKFNFAMPVNHKVLLTSVCRPLGPKSGEAPSVGYELLHRQVTRAQGLFSPRVVHHQFSLDYIAENLDAPAVVLQYPSKRELIR